MLFGTTLRHSFTAQEDQGPDFQVSYTDFGARQYNVNLRRWMVPDPMGEVYYDISPYVYCAGDPVRVVDRDGNFLETAWDAANVALDVASLRHNIKDKKVGAAIVDALGLTVDVIGAAAPFVPAGAGTAIKATRAVDKTAEVGKTSSTTLPDGSQDGMTVSGGGSYSLSHNSFARMISDEAIPSPLL